MFQLRRYLRAFTGTIALLWAGKKLPVVHPVLQEWVKQGQRLQDTAQQSMQRAGFTEDAQKKITLVIDRREISMFVIIGALRHNLYEEYPLLLRTQIEHQLTTFYAINLDDQYRLTRLLALPELQNAAFYPEMHALKVHLDAIPPSNTLE